MVEHRIQDRSARLLSPEKITWIIDVRPGAYQIMRRLPAMDREFQYVIRSTYDNRQRVAMESELSSN